MGFKCAIQFTGLTMGEPKPKKNGGKAKHRADGRHIMGEMGNERWSRSETLDRTRSDENVYYQEQESGVEVWDEMCERAKRYKRKVEKYIKKTGETKVVEVGVRKDAVIAVACIINPPDEVCRDWTEGEYEKFYEDTKQALYDFKKSDGTQLFRRENIRFAVEHRDEGMTDGSYHIHAVYDAIDEDGNYSLGNTLDSVWLREFNAYYPETMRRKGWDMDDYDTIDWERYNSDREYHEENKERVMNRGLSVNDFRALKISERLNEVEEVHKEMLGMLSEAQELSSEKESLEKKVEELKEEVEIEKKIKAYLKSSRGFDALEKEKEALKSSVTDLKKQKRELAIELQKIRQTASQDLSGAISDAKTEIDEYFESKAYGRVDKEQFDFYKEITETAKKLRLQNGKTFYDRIKEQAGITEPQQTKKEQVIAQAEMKLRRLPTPIIEQWEKDDEDYFSL